jgi:hypothetical protein
MSTQVQIRRGNTAQTATFTGAVAELTVDTDKEVVVVHDGVTAGGYPLARESALTSNQIFSQASFNTANAAFAAANSAGSYANSAFLIANSAAAYSNTVNNTQNNSITAAFTAANSAGVYANGAFVAANTADNKGTSAGVYANGAFAAANNEAGVNLTQNNSITAGFTAANSAGVYANGAFARANNSLNANTGGIITGDLTVTQNLSVGNLFVSGQTFSVSAGTIVANDTLIILGSGNYFSDTKDIGIAGHYNDGTNAHSGLIRDVGTKEWYLFKGYTPEIDANNNVIINDNSFEVDTLNANIKSTTITIKGIDVLPRTNIIFDSVNASFTAANSAGVYANGAFATANNEAGVNLTQNNSITAAFTAANSAGVYANGAFATANSADTKATSAGVYANGAFVAANTADVKATSAGIYANGAFAAANAANATDNTQNNSITAAFTAANSAGIYANGAFAQANTDFTNITISPSQAYGNATHIPIVTVSANGRINAISTVAVTATDPSAIAFAIALG